ncbi:SDR family NAD(P)-dependent oxidoreductase [Nonomuraea sp. NPDC005692]|uniref:SDR family NAD(P)-dependent oxidoreductase n=1 Tax=Nonomuraea sp. NPDC005692 TaxID=3157168 RepID=UPI0033DE3E24
MDPILSSFPPNSVAIVGMAVRAPSAPDLESFWAVCEAGGEATTSWAPAAGQPSRVTTAGLLPDVDLFDAAAFGLSPAEAEILDPQHRVFLELCWQALDQAGVAPDPDLLAGVYAAAAPSSYRVRPAGSEAARYQVLTSNEPDFLATRVSYLLNLQGEAINVQTGCSSSLVAVHLAVESLLAGNVDVALAGGVTVNLDLENGYVFEEGMISAPDGVCRPFDVAANGAVPGNGAGVVVLQRLQDAWEQRRIIHAVIRASAVNNDGAGKSSFLAPSRRGQADALLTAMARAQVPAESIGYLETHGTGTRLGDAIELAAAQDAFGALTRATGFCAIGSLKANFGHLDRAAGIVGLIKAALCVQRGVQPPLRNFVAPPPDFPAHTSAFTFPVNARPWTAAVRRAGVSSFGVGGTNAHVVVEQAPATRPVRRPAAGAPAALPLSAPKASALPPLERRVLDHIGAAGPDLDVLHTLARGRRHHPWRSVIVQDGGVNLRVSGAPDQVRGELTVALPAMGEPLRRDFGELLDRYPVARAAWEKVAEAARVAPDAMTRDADTPRLRAVARLGIVLAFARLLESFGIHVTSFRGLPGDPLPLLLRGDIDLDRCVDAVLGTPGTAAARVADQPYGEGYVLDLGSGAETTGELALTATMSHPGGCLPGLLADVATLWVAGHDVDWDAVNGSAKGAIAVLPAYPFERQSYWVHDLDEDDAPRARFGRCVLEEAHWVPRPETRADRPLIPAEVRVVGDGPLARALRDHVAAIDVTGRDTSGNAVVVVQADPAEREDFALSSWLRDTLLDPARALRADTSALVLVTRGAFAVLPGELPDPYACGLLGVARCAPHEILGLQSSILDLDPHGGASVQAEADRILRHLAARHQEDRAWRGRSAYQRTFRSVQAVNPSLLRRGGTYLVLGGTGNLGIGLAEAICEQTRARVVLAGRSARAPKAPAVVAAERRIQESGSRVEWVTADCTDREDLKRLLKEVADGEGRIDGIFHLAGDTHRESFQDLATVSAEAALATVEAKVLGARYLADELVHVDHDFVAMYSSLSVVTGARAFAPYVSANAFLDALAQVETARTARPWISIQWDGWSHDGRPSARGLSREEGARLLQASLCTRSSVVAPATERVEDRLRTIRRDLLAVASSLVEHDGGPDHSDALEATLAATRAVTGHAGVTADETFLAIGMDSLQMMRLAARLRPRLREEVTLAQLVACRTPRQASALLTAAQPTPGSGGPSGADLDRGALSTMQERLFYENQLGGGTDAYNVPFGWTVHRTVSEQDLRAAVEAVLDEHASLRAAFRTDRAGITRRTTIPVSAVPVTVHVADGEPGDLVQEFVSRPFDLAAASTRVLLRGDGERWRVVFVCHHISVDAWSTDLIAGSLSARLSGGHGTPAAGDYGDYVAWEQAFRRSGDHARQLGFWRETLRAAVPTLPPADEGDDDTRDGVGQVTRSVRPAALVGLQEILAIEGATLFAAALSALAAALCRWCRTDEVVIATNVSKRPLPQHESIVGLLVDPVLLRLRSRQRISFGENLAETRQRLVDAMGNADIPFLDVLPVVQRHPDARSAAFSVIATMFDGQDGDALLEPLDLRPPATAKFPLAVEFQVADGELRIRALFDRGSYRETTIVTVLEDMTRYLNTFAAAGPGGTVPRNVASTGERLAARLTSPVGDEGEQTARDPL